MTYGPMRACPACREQDHRRVMTEGEFVLLRCGNCDLVFLGNPPAAGVAYDDYHEQAGRWSADDYDPRSAQRELSELWQINSRRLDWLDRRAATAPLLDIGCGKGFFVRSACERGYDAEGIDVSAAAVRHARDVLQVRASTQSVDDLQAAGKTYRVITMWHVLEHFEDPVRELKAVYRLLEPGGMLVLEVPNFESLGFRLARKKWHGGNHPLYHRTFFTCRTLADVLHRSGFSQARRIRMSYDLPHNSAWRNALKRALNALVLDSFLDYYACK